MAIALRTAIQSRIIALFKSGHYYKVSYDLKGVPSVGDELVEPSVLCNEVSTSVVAKPSSEGMSFVFSGWSFEVICDFQSEVDYSDFVLTKLKDITFTHQQFLVTAKAGSTITVKHPVRQGGHSGTILQLNFNIETRR